MLKAEELLLGSHHSSQNTSVYAWNYGTGNIEQIYKNGGTTLMKSLCLLGNDYILTVNQDKPVLQIWPTNSQEQVKNNRFVMPEIVNCIDVDLSNNYLAAGIGLKIYVWHINSGKLLNILQKHYQPITCIKFSSDSAHTVASGKDGMLTVYKFDEITCRSNLEECEPIYTKMDHSSQINDICVGNFGSKSKIASISNDRTCRIYILETGELVLNLVFKEELTSVLFDSTSWDIYVGDVKGLISKFCLKNPPRTLEYHVTLQDTDNFVGHEKKITALDINYNNDVLASGSEDFTIIIWQIYNENILRKIHCKGIITNLKFVINHANFGVQTFNSSIVLHPFQKTIDTNAENFAAYGKQGRITYDGESEEKDYTKNDELENLQEEIDKLKTINWQLYTGFIKMAKEYNDVE